MRLSPCATDSKWSEFCKAQSFNGAAVRGSRNRTEWPDWASKLTILDLIASAVPGALHSSSLSPTKRQLPLASKARNCGGTCDRACSLGGTGKLTPNSPLFFFSFGFSFLRLFQTNLLLRYYHSDSLFYPLSAPRTYPFKMSSLLPDDYLADAYDPSALDAHSPEGAFDETSSGCYEPTQGDDWYVARLSAPACVHSSPAHHKGEPFRLALKRPVQEPSCPAGLFFPHPRSASLWRQAPVLRPQTLLSRLLLPIATSRDRFCARDASGTLRCPFCGARSATPPKLLVKLGVALDLFGCFCAFWYFCSQTRGLFFSIEEKKRLRPHFPPSWRRSRRFFEAVSLQPPLKTMQTTFCNAFGTVVNHP